jgi:hypothetical protein
MKGYNDYIFEGQYNNDNMEGYGRYEWSEGSIYEGQYKDDVKHGFGKYKMKDGYYYRGEWKFDEKDGIAEEIFDGKKMFCKYKKGQIIKDMDPTYSF